MFEFPIPALAPGLEIHPAIQKIDSKISLSRFQIRLLVFVANIAAMIVMTVLPKVGGFWQLIGV